MSHEVFCIKLKRQAPGLDYLPYPGALGQRIHDNISAEAWGMWVGHQTILINEYRLNLTDPQARKFLKEEMIKFLFEEGSDLPPGYTPS